MLRLLVFIWVFASVCFATPKPIQSGSFFDGCSGQTLSLAALPLNTRVTDYSAYSPSRNRYGLTNGDKELTWKIFQSSDREQLCSIVPREAVSAIFIPDGSGNLIVGTQNGRLLRYSMDTGGEVSIMTISNGSVVSVSAGGEVFPYLGLTEEGLVFFFSDLTHRGAFSAKSVLMTTEQGKIKTAHYVHAGQYIFIATESNHLYLVKTMGCRATVTNELVLPSEVDRVTVHEFYYNEGKIYATTMKHEVIGWPLPQ